FKLDTLYPLPARRIAAFLRGMDGVLIVEETAPYVETGVQAIAQQAGLMLPVNGRGSGHLPGAGELFAPDLTRALSALVPDWPWPPAGTVTRTTPSRQVLCAGCPYLPVIEALLAAMDRHGGRDVFFVTGETGCLVRAQLPPWEMLDAKYSMGSSIGL